MTERNHTAGPWEARIYGGFDAPRVWSESGSVALLQHHDTPEEAEANARLIAVAPDMLEALERMVRLLEIEDARLANFGEVEAARAVITKATRGDNSTVQPPAAPVGCDAELDGDAATKKGHS